MAGPGGQGANVAALLGQVKAGVSAVATTALQSVNELTTSVNRFTRQFVEALRPDVVQRFDLASRSMLATVGQALVPVMQLAEKWVKALADAVDGVYRKIRPLIDGGLSVLSSAFDAVIGTVKQAAAVSLDAWVPVLKQLIGVFRQLVRPVADLLKPLTEAGGFINRFQAAIAGGIVGVLKAAVPLMEAVGKIMEGVIPVLVTPFRLLAETAGPLVKIILTPLTVSLKLVGAVLGVIAPLVAELGKAVAEVAGELAALVGDLMRAFVDILGELWDALGELLQPVKDLAVLIVSGLVVAVRQVVVWVKSLVQGFRDLLGLRRQGGSGLDGERKFAVQQAQFTDALSAWKAVATATASMGKNQEADPPEERSASSLVYIAAWLRENREKIGKFLDGAGNVAKGVGSATAFGAATVAGPVPALLLDALRNTVLKSR